MSEIQRYSLKMYGNEKKHMGLFQESPDGELCEYTDLLWYKRHYWRAVIFNVVVGLVCALLATLLVYEKAARSPVSVPMGAGEKAELLKEVHAAKVAKDQAQADLKKARADYVASQAFFAGRAKDLEGKIAKDIQSLESPMERGREIDRTNKEQTQRMSTHQGVIKEAEKVLHVKNVKVIE